MNEKVPIPTITFCRGGHLVDAPMMQFKDDDNARYHKWLDYKKRVCGPFYKRWFRKIKLRMSKWISFFT